MRFFERERQDFAAELEPYLQLARNLDVPGQALLEMPPFAAGEVFEIDCSAG